MEDITWELKNLDSLKEYIFDELIGEHKNTKCIDEAINRYAERYHEMQLKLLDLFGVSDSDYRYPMTYDQPCQIDCRVTSCKFYNGYGKCENVSPAITLNENGEFVCWSKADR